MILPFNMASNGAKNVVHKLHAVTLIRSGIRQPWWEKRTIKGLGLTKLYKTVIHKNTATVNGKLRSVKHLIDIQPIEIVNEDSTTDANSGGENVFLKANGQFNLKKFQEYLKNNPEIQEVIQKRRKAAIWEAKRR